MCEHRQLSVTHGFLRFALLFFQDYFGTEEMNVPIWKIFLCFQTHF